MMSHHLMKKTMWWGIFEF